VVLFQVGYDVIVISPPEGAAGIFLIADSERATPIFYKCCIVTTRLSCTVFDLINFFVCRKCRHSDFVTRGRLRLFLITDSERATPTLYLCSNDTFCLSRTV